MVVISSTNLHNKEMSIRRRISSIYNKREDDFPSLRQYNDYLEEVEDMTFNLIEGIDVSAIEANISEYMKENSEQIMVNRARKAEELAAAMAASKETGAQTETDMDDVAGSQGGFSVTTQGQYAPTVAVGQPRQPVPLGGRLPGMQGYNDDEMDVLHAERGARAGGWSIDLSKKRSLEEAFNTLWV